MSAGENIQHDWHTATTKNCCAPGTIACAPGIQYWNTPGGPIHAVPIHVINQIKQVFLSPITKYLHQKYDIIVKRLDCNLR